MNEFAVFLVLLSTVFHATWNLLAKSQRSKHTFLHRAAIAVVLFGFAPILVLHISLPEWPSRLWLFIGLTGLFGGSYLFALARAYGSGDFTVVYPLARSVPVLLVGGADIFRGHSPTTLGWVGMALVAVACLIAPVRSLSEIGLKHYKQAALVWVILAAVATAGFSVVDNSAAELLPRGPRSAAVYCYGFYASSMIVFTLLLRLLGRSGEDRKSVGWRRPCVAAGLTFASYWLVVWSYQIVDRAGYVVAFRQMSILIGVGLGSFLFRERGVFLRVAAAVLMISGLILIALFGRSAP